LNEEQECAFKIVANHSVEPTTEQLLMHLGGMAGTGKSQVIKALISFFERRKSAIPLLDLGSHWLCSCTC